MLSGQVANSDRTTHFPTLLLIFLVNGILLANNLGITPEMIALVIREYGVEAGQRIEAWQNLVDRHQQDQERKKLESVNTFFNQNAFKSDLEHWQQQDYWATPIEFLSTRGGDCEDFAIAKYITLLALGVPDERLRITYVKALELDQAHMVVTYYATPKSIPVVLDNLVSSILPASQRSDLKPVYSFNGNGLWQAKMRGEGRKLGDSQDLNLWRDLTARLKKEKGKL